ncbi:MAG: hypothetical protein ACT4OE_06810 [Sphingosinicella sp.]
MSSRPPFDDNDSSLSEIVDFTVRRLATVTVIAAGVIALAIYARPSPPRYTAVPVGEGVVRVNGNSGTLIYCDPNGCGILVRSGSDLNRMRLPKAQPAAVAAPRATPALPAPSASRSPSPSPSPSASPSN